MGSVALFVGKRAVEKAASWKSPTPGLSHSACTFSTAPTTANLLSSIFIANKTRPTGFLVGPRSQVQTSTVEIDRVDEVLFVAKSSSRVFHPLNLGVDGLAGSVGNRMGQVGNDVLESPLQHGGDLLHRLWAAQLYHH